MAGDGVNFSIVVGFDFDKGERKQPLLPAVQRRHHEVAVVELQFRVELVHPSSPAYKIRWTENGNFEDLAGRIQPEVGALGKSRAKLCGFALCGVPQLNETLLRARNIEGRREAIGQTVVRLVAVDQPQRHPVLVGVEVENPSLQQFHKAPLRSEELSRRHRDAFPGRERWRAGSLPSGCRGPDMWPPGYSNAPVQIADRNAAGLLAARRAGTFSNVPL